MPPPNFFPPLLGMMAIERCREWSGPAACGADPASATWRPQSNCTGWFLGRWDPSPAASNSSSDAWEANGQPTPQCSNTTTRSSWLTSLSIFSFYFSSSRLSFLESFILHLHRSSSRAIPPIHNTTNRAVAPNPPHDTAPKQNLSEKPT